MDEDLMRMVAESLEATPELLPYMPELLVDCWALGSWPEAIVELLRPVGLPPEETQVVDIGCGKGAVGITLARELGFRVLGIDAFPPFIEECQRRAEELGVDHLCQFTCDDMRKVLRQESSFDIAVYAAHGPMLEGKHCIVGLREIVRPGGYVVLDDGYLLEPVEECPVKYEDYVSRDETIQRLTAYGDHLAGEVSVPDDEWLAKEMRDLENMRRRAEGLSKRHPEIADRLAWYVDDQRRLIEEMDRVLGDAVWLIRRVEGS